MTKRQYRTRPQSDSAVRLAYSSRYAKNLHGTPYGRTREMADRMLLAKIFPLRKEG